MDKIKKIFTYLFVFLVLISNAGYTFTSEICNMSKSKSCNCRMKKANTNISNEKGISFKSKSCCSEKKFELTNSSEFDNHKKVEISDCSEFVIISSSNNLQQVFLNSGIRTRLIYYESSQDIPILYSVFLI